MKSVKTINRDEKLRGYSQRHPDMSYAALGRVFKITRERVRQILSEDMQEIPPDGTG